MYVASERTREANSVTLISCAELSSPPKKAPTFLVGLIFWDSVCNMYKTTRV